MAGALVVGGGIGLLLARRVQMTQMPELVAILHSLVGLAAVLVGFANFLDPTVHFMGVEQTIHDVETYLGILIGAVTFSGSIIAFGKLSGRVTGKPLLIPDATGSISRSASSRSYRRALCRSYSMLRPV